MKFVKYGKFHGDPFGISAEDLARALSDYFLRSGFENQWMDLSEMRQQSLDELRDAIREALERGDLFPDRETERMYEQLANMSEEDIEQLIEDLMQKLANEGYVTISDPKTTGQPKAPLSEGEAGKGGAQGDARFEITDKGLDFLGYQALKDLMGGLGRSQNRGTHDTREFANGVESSGATAAYEFGQTLNLDINETLGNVIQRTGSVDASQLEYEDLAIRQSEYQSSCATVLMLDCSHSMILYGEDRFTPAKRVALALAQLIRTQFPGDSLHVVLFHDSAEELPVSKLARVQVGPFHTNTREGLRMAQQILRRERKEMQQIIMITDGKPSALTLEDGQIYKNPFGLDPMVIRSTFEEVHKCKRRGIVINTFMLARDVALVQFVQRVSKICRGKAYFTTPHNLGEYLLMDYMKGRSRMIH